MAVRNKPIARIPVEVVNTLWQGSVDMHIHPGPDPNAERPLDGAQMAKLARDAGMRGIVLKSFFYPTVSEAYIIGKMTPNVAVLGSVVISFTTTGGLEHAAETIETNGKIGCKVVWFPAMDAKWCRSYLGKKDGLSILNDSNRLKSEVYDILKVVKEYGMVVCSGHMSFPETVALFDAAAEMGISKMVATHPLAELSRFTAEQIQELAGKGAYIEHVYGTLMPRLGAMDPSDYVDCIKAVSAERSIMSTDLAQVWDPAPADGMRHFIGMMLQFGCTPDEVEFMVKKNPTKLLDLN
jgi:hypothetical protein